MADAFDDHAAWLGQPASHGGEAPERIDTHTAAVFLSGDRALKLRRPVDYGWLDYSTREKRLAAARREVDENARTAPGLALGLAGLVHEGAGFRLTGPGEELPPGAEPVTVMRRFPADALFERMAAAGRLTPALMHRTGRAVAEMHRGAALRPGTGYLPGMVRGDDPQFRDLIRLLGPDVEALLVELAEAHDRLRPAIERRRARRCHGDLHLGNIVLWQDAPAPFDAIDFNDDFTDIDPLYDLAFLLMDLDHRGHAELGPPVLNAWAEAMAATPGADVEAAYAGLALLPLYEATRAAIRAKVGALAVEAGVDRPAPASRGKRGGGPADSRLAEARGYLAEARRYLATPPAPRLIAVGGFSGTGKSTVARALAARTGAVVLRSDGTRKGLWGVPEGARLPPETYTRAASDRVYGEILCRAALALGAGMPVVLDAAHLREDERARAEALARRLAVPFRGVWLDAPPDVLRDRLDARRGDVSDADAGVLEIQLARDPGPIDWARIPADGPPDSVSARALAQADVPPAPAHAGEGTRPADPPATGPKRGA